MATTPPQARTARTIALIDTTGYRILERSASLIAALVSSGQRVVALAPDMPQAARAGLESLGAATETFPMRPGLPASLGERKARNALVRLLRTHAAHAVLAAGPKTMAIGALAARKAGTARILVAADALTEIVRPRERSLSLPWRWLLRSGFRAADTVLCTTMDEQRTLASAGLLSAIKSLKGMPAAAVDLDQFALAPLPPPADGIVFLGLGGNARNEGAADFLRALTAVRAVAPNVRVLLAGPELAAPEGLPRSELSLSGMPIEFAPTPADLRPLLARSHVVIETGRTAGRPGAIAQALAAGRAVIAADLPGNRETVDAKVNGILYTAGDVPSLIGAIENILRRPDLLPAMSQASRRKAERWFDARVVNAELMSELKLG